MGDIVCLLLTNAELVFPSTGFRGEMMRHGVYPTGDEVVRDDTAKGVRQDGYLSPWTLKVGVVLAKQAVQSVELPQEAVVNLIAIERTAIVHDVHEGAVEEGAEATEVA